MKKTWIRLVFYGVLLFSCFFVSTPRVFAQVEIHGIDVGYGDAILIRLESRQGKGPVILIDGGDARDGPKLVKYLKSQQVEALDVVICTHSHPDHAGGLLEIIQSFTIKEVWTNGERMGWLDHWARRKKFLLVPLNKGVLKFNDWVKIEVLNVWHEGLDPNEGSLALIFIIGETRLLFAGDISPNIQRRLLDTQRDLSSEFLKVPHHGWGVLSEFLRAVRPKAALLSVGSNPYGAPEREVLEVLERLGSKIYRTDRDGTVVIEINE